MAGKLIEFPRKLEWSELPCWVGFVKGTTLLAKVERAVDGDQFQWAAWNAGSLLDIGLVPTLEAGQEAARRAMESSVLVIRPLSSKDGP